MSEPNKTEHGPHDEVVLRRNSSASRRHKNARCYRAASVVVGAGHSTHHPS
jgi:hypothetical protein